MIRAQAPIRVLAALRWPDSVKHRFLAAGADALPHVEYEPLPFDTQRTDRALRAIQTSCDRRDPLQRILRDTAAQYRRVIALLQSRGSRRFLAHSQALYGSARSPFFEGGPTSLELAEHVLSVMTVASDPPVPSGTLLSASESARELRKRFGRFFGRGVVGVAVSSTLTADAAAGAARLSVRKGTRFDARTLDYLEQHEGYVHIATSLNGAAQPVLPILGKAAPHVIKYNEGLAVFSEWASGTLTGARLRKLATRVVAVDLAEQGADFVEVFRQAREHGYAREHAYDLAHRIFRGGNPAGGALFTKDTVYLEHFMRVFDFSRAAMLRGRLDLLRLLFAGKVALPDLPALAEAHREGLLAQARYLPPWLARPDWLSAHLGLSSFFNRIDLHAVSAQHERIFRDG